MKHITWFVAVAALLLGCSPLAAAQCAGVQNPGGFDLLQTFSGTSDSHPSDDLGPITFTGVALPGGGVGTADTIVCRKEALGSPDPSGTQLDIQIVALYMKGDSTYQGQSVTVYATINQTQDSAGNYKICHEVSLPNCPASKVLPQLDQLPASTGTMTVFPGGRFDTNQLNVQADLIIVPHGGLVTDPPLAHMVMQPADTISAFGSTWTSTAPAGYPNSATFPAGGFYVNDPSGHGSVVPLIASRLVRGSLYALGLFLVAIAVLKIRSGISGRRLSMQPVYLLGLAAIAWFLGWKSNKLTYPTIAHAAAFTTCVPHTISAWVSEGGTVVLHKIVTAVCTTISTTSSTAL